jgi:hypothetical protein
MMVTMSFSVTAGIATGIGTLSLLTAMKLWENWRSRHAS